MKQKIKRQLNLQTKKIMKTNGKSVKEDNLKRKNGEVQKLGRIKKLKSEMKSIDAKLKKLKEKK